MQKESVWGDSLNKKLFVIFLVVAGLVSVFVYLNRAVFQETKIHKNIQNRFDAVLKKPTSTMQPTATFLPTPTPTPRPLTFAEMNLLYGPCAHLPVFYYHHIQSRSNAIADKQSSLTVDTDIFKSQMQYLKDKGYNVVSMQDLVNFFNDGIHIPPNSVALTFDDGYQDFYTDAYPILKDLNFKSTVFTITGLVNNPDYFTWDEISQMGGIVLFGNHTWSHRNLPTASDIVQQSELTTADAQLSNYSLNSPKVFAYPYGGYTSFAEKILNSLGYQLAFGTAPGSIMCKKQRFHLPRVRIGNAALSYYGF